MSQTTFELLAAAYALKHVETHELREKIVTLGAPRKRHSASSCKCCRESADPAHFVSSLGLIAVIQSVKRRQEKLQAVSAS